jgi:hypothetical protein
MIESLRAGRACPGMQYTAVVNERRADRSIDPAKNEKSKELSVPVKFALIAPK